MYKMGRPIWHFKHILDMAASFGLPGPKSILTPMGGTILVYSMEVELPPWFIVNILTAREIHASGLSRTEMRCEGKAVTNGT